MATSEAQKKAAAQRKRERMAWGDWQENPRPIGWPVEVTKDDGSKVQSKTRSEPWMLGSGTPVVMVEGISGGYLLTRVRVLPPSP